MRLSPGAGGGGSMLWAVILAALFIMKLKSQTSQQL
jgi:hypothetical protein